MYKAIVTDLDGTLLRSDGSISPRTVATLQEMRRRGIPVIACTGRCISEAMDVLAGYPLSPIMVLLTGTLVLDTRTQTILHRNCIQPDLAGEILDLLRRDPHNFFYVYCGENLHAFPEMWEKISACGLNQKDIACTQRWMRCDENLAGHIRSGKLDCEKIFAIAPGEARRRAIERSISGRVEVIRAGEDRLEILAKGNSKRRGLMAAFSALNLKPEHTIAFGDSENDIPVAQTCATFVSMENADPELKKYAAAITTSNDDDGVAIYIEQLMQNKQLQEDTALWI